MFEELAEKLSDEMLSLSNGSLHCLPYSRALLDVFEAQGKCASPLVVRGVVFGRPESGDIWKQLGLPKIKKLIKAALESPRANAGIVLEFTPEGSTQTNTITVPFRTIGFPHSEGDGDKTLGNYENGQWLGHLVVVADNTVIDLTIGQLNNNETFAINFVPPYVIIEADDNFLAGKSPLIGEQDGMLVAYFAFPTERTYQNSESWNKPDLRQQLKCVADRVAKLFADKPVSPVKIISSVVESKSNSTL